MGESSSGASRLATKIEVGPSMAPITPIAADSSRLNPSAAASNNVRKIPNCPAAPSSAMLGIANSGVKSIIAPMPMKISSGKSSVRTPEA